METSEKRKIVAIMIVVGILVSMSLFFDENKKYFSEAVKDQEKLIAEATEKEKKIVNISGAVIKPGVYSVDKKARVEAVILLAGGFAPEADVSKVNQSILCRDGMQIRVPEIKAKTSKLAKLTSGKNKATEPVFLNSATEKELLTLPGIGPSLAKKIIEYREKYGNFKTLEQIKDVGGIGSSKYEAIKERIRL